MQPTLADLQPILAGIGQPPVVAIAALKQQFGQVYRLDLEDGKSLVLKSFVVENISARKDAYAAGLVAHLDVPVTRYLLVDESMTRLPFSFAVTSYLEGAPATAFARHAGYRELLGQIGVLMKTLHGVTLPAFGELPEPAYTDNIGYVRDLADYAFPRFVEYGGGVTLAERLRNILDRDIDRVAGASTLPVFAHNDLHPNNILATERGGHLTLSGLIDFGNARASAGVMDLAKTIFMWEHDAPGCAPAILDGYGPIDHPSPREALAFYTLLHRVTMWWWLRHIGALPTADAANDIIPARERTAAEA